jgi:uncharacterized protein
MRFSICGHENTLATHATTLEFTTEDFLTRRGDCILGINADFKSPKIETVKVKVTISGHGLSDSLVGYYNPLFTDKKCMVIRTSRFLDGRTIITGSNKAAKDIDRRIVEKMKSPQCTFSVSITPVDIKAVIFDFDNTLEEWNAPQEYAREELERIVHERYKVPIGTFSLIFHKVQATYEGNVTDPLLYGRDVWIAETFKKLGISSTDKEIQQLEKEYWAFNNSRIRWFPGAVELLQEIKAKKAILTDADGDKRWKEERIRLLDVRRHVPLIVTSSDTGRNKPDIANFLLVAERLGVMPEECVMVGDHPETDLIGAKRCGMSTVLVCQSHWCHDASYIDYKIDKIAELPSVLAKVSL